LTTYNKDLHDDDDDDDAFTDVA